jgi:hypothetical protein
MREGTGATKYVAALATPIPAGGTLATPFKRSWCLVPMVRYGCEPADNLVRRLWVVSGEGTPRENALD